MAYGVRTYAVQGVGLPVPEVKDQKENNQMRIGTYEHPAYSRVMISEIEHSLYFILRGESYKLFQDGDPDPRAKTWRFKW